MLGLPIRRLAASLSLVLAARAAGAASPTAAELAPITIPQRSSVTNDFAQQLDLTCSSVMLLAAEPVAGGLDTAALRTSAAAAATPWLQHLKHACLALDGVLPFTQTDMDALNAIYDDGDHAGLASLVAKLATGGAGSPQGPVPPVSAAGAILDTVVQGIGQFIYDRAKAEAISYLLKLLDDQLCSSDERVFFGHICLSLANANSGASLNALGTYFANAAKQDLAAFPDLALAYALSNVSAPDAKDALFGARIGVAYYRAVASGRAPLEVARSLHDVQLEAGYDPAPEERKVIAFASQFIDAVTAQSRWNLVTVTTTQNQALRCYALGAFIALQRAPITGAAADAYKLDAFVSALPQIATAIADLIALASQTATAVQQLKAGGAPASGDDAGGFTRPGAAAAAPAGKAPVATSQAQLQARYAALATQVLRLVARGGDLAAKLKIFSQQDAVRIQAVVRIADLGEQLAAQTSAARTVTAVIDLLSSLRGTVSIEPPAAVAAAEKYLPFISQLADAQSPDDIEKVLVVAASPPDAYLTKYSKPQLNLNALVGLSGGAELAFSGNTSGAGVVGAFAPIGIEATTPVGDSLYVGGFLSVVNLGSIVSARFSQDTTTSSTGGSSTIDSSSNVNFTNLVSPGVFLTFGLFKGPFLVGLGAQAIPARAVTQTLPDGTTHASSIGVIQVLGFLAIDVPLLGF